MPVVPHLFPWLHRRSIVVAAFLPAFLSNAKRQACVTALSTPQTTNRHFYFNSPLPLSTADARARHTPVSSRNWSTAAPFYRAVASEHQDDTDVTDNFSSSDWNALDQEGSKNYRISNMLVVGDGDLSYSAAIASELADIGINLTATVLEDQERHHAVYQNSRVHTGAISAHDKHVVRFGINATDLSSHFPEKTHSFDRIQFNFPHWRGKANHRYNRALLNSFLESASEMLSPRGEIHVALCEGQGGATATSRDEWRQSWKAAEYAAEYGLLLMDVSPFKPRYDLSSHRGMDRAFTIGKVPKMYIFSKPSGIESKAERRFQMCCRHELHINIPSESEMKSSRFELGDIIQGNAIQTITEAIVDPGIRVEIPMRKVLSPEETNSDTPVAVYLVVYCGEWTPITREKADKYRSLLEEEVREHVPLRGNRAGRIVSKMFPYPLLQQAISYSISWKSIATNC